MRKLCTLLVVSFWLFVGLAHAQTTYTPTLHLAKPEAAPNSFGSLLNGNFDILDSAVGFKFQNEGLDLPFRPKVNFTNSGINCLDNAALNRIDCDVSGGGGGSVDPAAGYNWLGQHTFTIDPTVNGSPLCLQNGTNCPTAAGAQPLDADLTGIAALSGTGVLFHIGAGSWTERTLTGVSGEITIDNPAGIAGNPLFHVGANVALNTRSFTVAGFDWDFSAATSVTISKATGCAPTIEGRICTNTTNHRMVFGNGTTTKTFAFTDEIQPLNANLTALANQTGAANRFSFWTGPGTLGLGILPAAPCGALQAVNITSVSPYQFDCVATSGISGGSTNVLPKYSSATALTPSIMSEVGGNILIAGGLAQGCTPAVDCLNWDTLEWAGHLPATLIVSYTATASPKIPLRCGAIPAGNIVTPDANGCFVNGGAAGTGTWTDSSVSVGDHKTLIDALAGGGTANVIRSQLVASFDGGGLTASSGCQDAIKAQINSGHWQYVILCATPASAQFGIVIPDLKQAVGTFFVRLRVNDTVSSAHHFAGTFKAQCRATGDTENNTWGSTQTVDITMTTANVDYDGVTAAITANGSCAAHTSLAIQFDANGSMTDTGTARILSASVEQQS